MGRRTKAQIEADKAEQEKLDDGFEITDEETDTTESKPMTTPAKKISPLDPGWTDHILKQLLESEVFEGNPKTDGLRRLVEKEIGPILGCESNVIECPRSGCDHSRNTATVVVKIHIMNAFAEWLPKNKMLLVSATADASCESCGSPFDKFLTPIAETRARGRSYREALRLTGVVTSDEMPVGDTRRPVSINDNLLSEEQIFLIDKKCKTLNIGVKEVMLVGTENKEEASIKKYTKDDGSAVLARIAKLETVLNNSPDSKPPISLGSYEANWKDYFG